MGPRISQFPSQAINPLPAVLSPLAAASEALGLKQKQQALDIGQQELVKGQLAAQDEQTLRALAQKHGGDPEKMLQELKIVNPRLGMIFGEEYEKRKIAADAVRQAQATGMRNEAIKNAELLQGQPGQEFGTTGMAPTYQAPLPELGHPDVLEQGTPAGVAPDGTRIIGPQEHAPVQIPSAYGGAPVTVRPQTRAGMAANAAEELRRKTEAQIAVDRAKQKAEFDYNTTAPKTATGIAAEYEYAVAHGYKGSFEQYQNEDANRKKPPAAPGSEPLVPTTDAFGNTVYTPRSQAAGLKVPTSSQNKPPTSAERKMLGFYERVSNSLDKIDSMEADINKMDVIDQARLKYAPNIFQTNVGQRFTQAANDFINASLRRESGAAISDGEYKRFQQIYFPMPGDSKETLAQKKKARDVQLETFKTESGKAFAEKYGDERKSSGGAGKIRVRRKSDGQTGTLDSKDFDASKYEKL